MNLSHKFRRFCVLSVTLLILLPGCVSKGTYQDQLVKNQSLANEFKREQEKNNALKSNLDETKKTIDDINSKLAKARDNIDDLEKNVLKVEGELGSEKDLGARKEKEFKEKIKGLEKKVTELEKQLALEKKLIKNKEEEFKNEIASLKTKFEEEKTELSRSKNLNQDRLLAQHRKMNQLMGSLRLSLKEKAKKERELQESSKTYKALIGSLQNEIKDGVIKISKLQNSLSMEILDKIMFASGSIIIKKKGKELLGKLSNVLKKINEHNIRIEGHTDNIPIGKTLAKRFPTNWELSSSRATQVVRYLIDKGVDPEKLLPVGLSKYRPVATNNTLVGRRQNRRIEIILFPKDIKKIDPSSK